MLRPVNVASAAPVTPRCGNGSQSENEDRIEDQIDDVRDPEQAHGDGRIACSAEDRVVEEEHDDRAATAERDARVAGASGDDGGRSSHQAEEVRGFDAGRNSERRGNEEPEHDGLNGGDGGVFRIFLADAARHHRGGGQGNAEADGEDQSENRLGQSDGGDGIGAEPPDPEGIDHGKERFEHHLQHHGDGEQQDRAIQAAGGEVLMRTAQGFADRRPETTLGLRLDGETHRECATVRSGPGWSCVRQSETK